MTIALPEDRFRELGMKPPDLGFLKAAVPPSQVWGSENMFGTRTLVGNWFEDRRAYKQLCSRCTGHSITRTDYLAPCKEDISQSEPFPPVKYARQIREDGQGPSLLRNTEDYCDYLQNYTTTYDLMHNWEVRRAGCKPKPWRKWKLICDATWFPDRDNTYSFGNLTQLGYRKAPQVPMLPNDWDVYANNPTTYESHFGQPRYPDHYTHCRMTAPREIRRENEEMMMIRAPNTCEKCKEDHDKIYSKCRPEDGSCPCVCHAIETALKNPPKKTKVHIPYNNPRFDKFIPAVRMMQKPGVQNVYAADTVFPYRTLKHPPHPYPRTCDPTGCPVPPLPPGKSQETSPFKKPDICTDFAGDVRRE